MHVSKPGAEQIFPPHLARFRPATVALLFGRRHRGESVKTGQEQGVMLDDPLLSALLAGMRSQLSPADKIFNTNETKSGRVWREMLTKSDLGHVGPLHTLRHSGPSEDVTSGARKLLNE